MSAIVAGKVRPQREKSRVTTDLFARRPSASTLAPGTVRPQPTMPRCLTVVFAASAAAMAWAASLVTYSWPEPRRKILVCAAAPVACKRATNSSILLGFWSSKPSSRSSLVLGIMRLRASISMSTLPLEGAAGDSCGECNGEPVGVVSVDVRGEGERVRAGPVRKALPLGRKTRSSTLASSIFSRQSKADSPTSISLDERLRLVIESLRWRVAGGRSTSSECCCCAECSWSFWKMISFSIPTSWPDESIDLDSTFWHDE
mmetsp:Transcript_108348/g.314979  ORF Transcript_108348/g.314979 Transcript_108348/m.314979 type:complete len:259 (-) Transcript_108348:872-1648(-)